MRFQSISDFFKIFFVIPAILRQAQDGERSRTKAGIRIPGQAGDDKGKKHNFKLRLFFNLGIGLLAFVMAVGLFRLISGIVSAQQADPGAQLLLGPAEVAVNTGGEFTVGLGLDTAETIMGIDALLRFNSDLLEVVNVQIGSSELKTLAPGENNVIDLNRAVKVASDPQQSTLEFSLVAFDQTTQEPTPGTSGLFDPLTRPLATITFRAKTSGSTRLEFVWLSEGETIDTNAVIIDNNEPVDIVVEPATQVTINISAACVLPYDFDRNGAVDIADIMQVAARWNSGSGDPNYDTRFDTDSDGDIDIVDIQRVSARWGERCEQ